jgi:hypothetical protein
VAWPLCEVLGAMPSGIFMPSACYAPKMNKYKDTLYSQNQICVSARVVSLFPPS